MWSFQARALQSSLDLCVFFFTLQFDACVKVVCATGDWLDNVMLGLLLNAPPLLSCSVCVQLKDCEFTNFRTDILTVPCCSVVFVITHSSGDAAA